MKSLVFLGRQPTLGLAELESLFGSTPITPLGNCAGLEIAASDVPFERLGGSIKLAEILAESPKTSWIQIEKALLSLAPARAAQLDSGKLTIGLSVYGMSTDLRDITATALRLKKAIRARTGQNVRVVQNQSAVLSSAQIINNHLTNERGMELVVFAHKDAVYLARTAREQNITAYARRDQNRPKRDARVGMLPPKLAQLIVNLAVGDAPGPQTVLDPFCGTGVVLQEAALMGYNVYGSDIEPRMISYSEANLHWLNETHKLTPISADLAIGDATSYQWSEPFSAVAAEGYLGQPFSGFPSEAKLREVRHTCNQIAKGFLKNLAEQAPTGTRICIGLPAWRQKNGSFVHLNMLDSLDELGYNRVSFVHVDNHELLYYREDQYVARELVVITRK